MISKYTISFGLSLAIASVMNGLLVVAKEKIPSVMAGLQHMTGHHWVSQAAIVAMVFAAFGWGLAQVNGGGGLRVSAQRLAALVVCGVAIGGLIIFSFYLTAG